MTVTQDTMRALVFTAPGAMELQDVARPVVPDGWLPIAVRASGICGSELHGFRSVGFRLPSPTSSVSTWSSARCMRGLSGPGCRYCHS